MGQTSETHTFPLTLCNVQFRLILQWLYVQTESINKRLLQRRRLTLSRMSIQRPARWQTPIECSKRLCVAPVNIAREIISFLKRLPSLYLGIHSKKHLIALNLAVFEIEVYQSLIFQLAPAQYVRELDSLLLWVVFAAQMSSLWRKFWIERSQNNTKRLKEWKWVSYVYVKDIKWNSATLQGYIVLILVMHNLKILYRCKRDWEKGERLAKLIIERVWANDLPRPSKFNVYDCVSSFQTGGLFERTI